MYFLFLPRAGTIHGVNAGVYQFSMPSFVVMIVLIPFCQSCIFLPYIYFFGVEGFEFVGVVVCILPSMIPSRFYSFVYFSDKQEITLYHLPFQSRYFFMILLRQVHCKLAKTIGKNF